MHNDCLGEHLLSEDATTLTFKDAIKCAEAFECARAECNHSQVISAVQAPVQSAKWLGQVVKGLAGKEQ